MTNNKDHSLPSVSVIVPAYNAEKNIDKLIKSLLRQDYPQELLEIIIIDNNSADRTRQMIREYPVKLLEEKEIQSSYAARNKGVRHAGGEVLAFIDSDCEASPRWIERGVNALDNHSADLAGGKIEFVYSQKGNAAEYVDSITNMQIEFNIKQNKHSKTANLFAKAFLFDKIGPFPDRVKSGGDVQWTSKAVRNGFRLVYAPEAVVKHPARTLVRLLVKNFRAGRGTIPIWIQYRRSLAKMLYFLFMLFKPPRLSSVRKLIAERGRAEMNGKLLRIWLVSYLCNLCKVCGILMSIPFCLSNRDGRTV